jgi:hypothetical protein
VLGSNPSRLIGPCLSPFEPFGGMRPGREPSGAGTLQLGVAFRLSVMLGRDLEPKIFWGHDKSARGEEEPSPAPPRLDPDGWLVRIPRTQRTETTGAQTARGARWAPSNRSAEANTPGRKRCGSLTRAF